MNKYLLIALLLCAPLITNSQPNGQLALRTRIQSIIDSLGGKVGVGVLGLDFKESLLVNDEHSYPMQSVYKMPLAIAILHQVDRGKLSLQQRYSIDRAGLMKNTWSPMLTDFPGDKMDISLADLLRYSVSKSDNNACDILFGIAGGPKAVDQYFKQAGIKNMNIANTEGEMHKDWSAQYRNWARPSGMLQLLQLLYTGKLLQTERRAYLLKLMTESDNSNQRIKGALPASAIVAHKTGTSSTNAEGLRGAANDVGIITLPDGRHYALVVFASDFKASLERGEATIAAISRAVWDYMQRR